MVSCSMRAVRGTLTESRSSPRSALFMPSAAENEFMMVLRRWENPAWTILKKRSASSLDRRSEFAVPEADVAVSEAAPEESEAAATPGLRSVKRMTSLSTFGK